MTGATTQPAGQADLLDLLAISAAGARQPHKATWLLEHLRASGHITESGASRRARVRTCRCGRPVIVGLDDEVCAFEVWCDPAPLSPLGEAMARVEGRWTFGLSKAGGRFELDRRDASSISFSPAGTRIRLDVLREHRCKSSLLPADLTLPTSFAEARPPRTNADEPDF